MNKQQTAVDWLYNQIKIASPEMDVINTDHLFFYRLYRQAKQMEKKQHEETWFDSRIEDNGEAFIGKRVNFEQYYNQTYGTE